MALEDRRQYQQACTRCSQCKFVPMPASKVFSSICPSMDHGHFHAFSGGGKVITSYALLEGKAEITPALVDSVFSCTMCGACDSACKTNMGENIEPLDTLYELRAYLAKLGQVPRSTSQLVAQLVSEGSPYGLRAQRNRWVDNLHIKDAPTQGAQVLLYIGGSMAYEQSQWPQLRLLVSLLEEAQIDFGIDFAETDAGGLAYDLGFREESLTLAQGVEKRLRQSGATLLLAASAEDYAAFKGIYPRLGVNLESVQVLHASEYIFELVRDGRLDLRAGLDARVTFHDSCRLGRLSETYHQWSGAWQTVLNTVPVPEPRRPARFGNGGNYEAPRNLLRRAGVNIAEMERNRQFAYCCGAGAGADSCYPEMAEQAALQRLAEAQATGVDCVVTACAKCQLHMAGVARKHGVQMDVQDVFELIADRFERGNR